MHKIINKQIIGSNIKRLEVAADVISRKAQPGQFVMVMPDEKSERIPLSVIDNDPQKGIITLIFEEVDDSSKELGALHIGDSVFAILGPLGLPAEIKHLGVVLCVGYEIGIAQLLSISRAYRKMENKVIGLVGAATKRTLILESQMRLACQKLYLATEDGSYERRGAIIDILSQIIHRENVNLVYAIGPLAMMQAVSEITQQKKIKTLVSLKPMMVDGIGLCGSCRVKVEDRELLACMDGPEFDGHAVDFEDLAIRTNP